MHIDNASRQYKTAGGETRASRCYLLRRSYRDELGRPRNETLANLSALPDHAIKALGKVLAGATLVDAADAFEVERSVPHGDVAAAHAMASRLELRDLLGPDRTERDIAYALVLARAVRPGLKLAAERWWAGGNTTLGADLGVAGAGTDEIHAVTGWLSTRQRQIEAELVARHLADGGIARFYLSRSWVRRGGCELVRSGHARDGNRGRLQVEVGVLTDAVGRPVAVEVLPGKTSDPESFKTAIARVQADFSIGRLMMVGDRRVLTGTRIDDLRELEAMDWVTALKTRTVKKLAAGGGALRRSLFDVQDLAEITHPDYPGERLICCRNPEQDAGPARARVEANAAAGGDLDGIYVVRTSVPATILDAAAAVTAYKHLEHMKRDFPVTKAGDLDLRSMDDLTGRVRGHVLIGMLACYLAWHLRQALAELTVNDQHIPQSGDPLTPAWRSDAARAQEAVDHRGNALPRYRYRDLLAHLATLHRQTISFADQKIEKLTLPTPVQARAFALIGAPVPFTLR
jgi:hypothetical protein